MTFGWTLKDLDLRRSCAEGVAGDAVCPLVPDRIVSQSEINKY